MSEAGHMFQGPQSPICKVVMEIKIPRKRRVAKDS